MIHDASLSVKPDLTRTGKIRLLACLLFAFASIVLAEKATEVNDDFLEYLGSMENDDDNWSDFTKQQNTQGDNAAIRSHQSSSASSDSANSYADTHSASARSHK